MHVDAARDGTASLDEFRRGLRENHSENEMEYTPSVSAVKRLVQWDEVEQLEGIWTGVDMHGEYMHLPDSICSTGWLFWRTR